MALIVLQRCLRARCLLRSPRFSSLVEELEREFKPNLITRPKAFPIEARERRIFDLLSDVIADRRLGTQLRVAGGWVRDKLLLVNKSKSLSESKSESVPVSNSNMDLDIAVDNMTGHAFARHVRGYLRHHRIRYNGIALVRANPEKSVHLETARLNIFNQWVDLVNLRTEVYAGDSRVPTMDVGTPLEDAFRRDFTVNSLFYNVQTNTVEDYTGRGLEDLEAGIIRTPLAADLILSEDPLRVLRAFRFASNLQMQLDPELAEAASNPDLQCSLSQKVSRERIGVELTKAIFRPSFADMFLHIANSGLYPIVFENEFGWTKKDISTSLQRVEFIEKLSKHASWNEPDSRKMALTLAAAMSPRVDHSAECFMNRRPVWQRQLSQIQGEHKPSYASVHKTLLHMLKISSKTSDEVCRILHGCTWLIWNKDRTSQLLSDRCMVEWFIYMGQEWPLAVYLSEAIMTRASVDEVFALAETLRGCQAATVIGQEKLVNGQDLAHLFQKASLGRALHEVQIHQALNPDMTKAELIQWISECHEASPIA